MIYQEAHYTVKWAAYVPTGVKSKSEAFNEHLKKENRARQNEYCSYLIYFPDLLLNETSW